MKWLAVAVIGLSMTSMAQTAKVIQLDPSDASKMAKLQSQRALLDKEISQLTDAIREKYLKATKEEEGHTSTYGYSIVNNGKEPHYFWVKSGWGAGNFEFSDDFKFIVPSYHPVASSSPSACGLFSNPSFIAY